MIFFKNSVFLKIDNFSLYITKLSFSKYSNLPICKQFFVLHETTIIMKLHIHCTRIVCTMYIFPLFVKGYIMVESDREIINDVVHTITHNTV